MNILTALKYIVFAGVLIRSIFFCSDVVASPCSVKDGAIHNYVFDVKLNSAQNYAGYEIGWIKKESSGDYYVGGRCNPSYNVFWSGTPLSDLVDEGNGWYSMPENPYLSVSTQIKIYSTIGDTKYYTIPFTDVNNHCSQHKEMCSGAATSGSSVNINLKIKRPFVGFVNISRDVAVLSGNNNSGESSRNPMAIVHLNATFSVPQSCELNTGDIITMDFGSIGAPLFSQAGVGNKPAGVNPQTKTIDIKCKNMDAQAILALRLEANKVSGNAMVSNNKDVGFIVADAKHNPLTPNNIDSKIPFRLDDNFSATVPVSAWPVSVTGNKPAEGKFTAEGYLRIDFD